MATVLTSKIGSRNNHVDLKNAEAVIRTKYDLTGKASYTSVTVFNPIKAREIRNEGEQESGLRSQEVLIFVKDLGINLLADFGLRIQ